MAIGITYPIFSFQGPPKFTRIGIFGFKTYHLATLFKRVDSFFSGAKLRL
jgi:hypothetical protein